MALFRVGMVIVGIFFLLSPVSLAAEPLTAWNILKDKSILRFTGYQNGVPLEGRFEEFNAKIFFNPDKLPTSSVKVTIMMDSATSEFEEVTDSLKKDDWFATSRYPTAEFESRIFTHVGGNAYEARGSLTMRGIRKDVILPFTLDITKKDEGLYALVSGSLTIKRSDFGIGQGEWASTAVVADEVKINIEIAATHQP